MSLLNKKWIIRNEDETADIIDKLLKNRGIDTAEKADSFFNDSMDSLHDPMLFIEMDKAVHRIESALKNKEKIMIFGDYDVDGITATALVYAFLREMGADAHYTLPHRENDGYGLRDYFIEKFKKEGIQLLITVDCGTSNAKEVKLANELGMDVVITDHHTLPGELPPAVAVVNPQRPDCPYPNKNACGAAIAFKLISVLAYRLLPQASAEEFLSRQLGITALGIVADCMPLKGENRILVREGIRRLAEGKHPGILSLLEEAGLSLSKMNSTMLGFQIGPRLNAAGRLDDPIHAFDLLNGDTKKAFTLNELNNKRKTITQQCIEEAMEELKKNDQIPNIIVLKNKNWKAGLLGLIAGGLSDHFKRPVIAMQERDDEFVASMRSRNGFDITGALRKSISDLCTAFGGHTMAGGFSLPKKNFEEFTRRVDEIARTQLKPEDFTDILVIDCLINPEDLNFETSSRISRFEPFGQENPEPLLLIKNARIFDVRPVGGKGEHMQFLLQCGSKTVSAIGFRMGKHLDKIDTRKLYDVVCHLEINEWNGNKKLQLRIVDLKAIS